MRALTLLSQAEGSLIDEYASGMAEAIVRRRAEIAVNAARIEAELTIKARSEFLANMNHELRTPLNAIIGFATMLRDGGAYRVDKEKQEHYSEYILQSADLLLGHLNTILEVAALESGSVEVSDEAIDFSAILDAAVERAGIQGNAANVAIERRDEGVGVMASGDAERAGQAVDHLLQTSIRTCTEGGRILVRACSVENGWAEIAVRDNGEGLTKEEVRQSLEAFKQVHRGLDRSFSGPGVGYAVAKTFIEMQGGRFFIKSRKGEGTLVRIMLPPPRNDAVYDTQPDNDADESLKGQSQSIVERTEDAA